MTSPSATARLGQSPGDCGGIDEAGDATKAIAQDELDHHGVKRFHPRHGGNPRAQQGGRPNRNLPFLAARVDQIRLPNTDNLPCRRQAGKRSRAGRNEWGASGDSIAIRLAVCAAVSEVKRRRDGACKPQSAKCRVGATTSPLTPNYSAIHDSERSGCMAACLQCRRNIGFFVASRRCRCCDET